MQKWEYGFFNIHDENEKIPGKLGSKIYVVAYLNGKPIAKFDPTCPASLQRFNPTETAFNLLGSMGWELVSYSPERPIVFKRPIE